ncbi:hypothetical protein N0V82_005470 [Gnomoniopsis sp. IMI 355080]|nr:hypothetical protein N0V82_005470 [Gnomoniopsis sp. IMI 355080]
MTASAAAMRSTVTTTSEIGQSLSGIFGCISLVAWICLLLPQLITNYKAKSADGLSMGFLLIWLLGDLTNLAGALATNLTPSAIAIGIYFCFADAVLITQCVYYNTLNSRKRRRARLSLEAENAVAAEEEPLLSPRRRSSSSANGGLPGSQRRHSVRRGSSGLDPLARMITGEDETPQRSAWLTNTLSLGAVYALGVAAWFVSREVVGTDAGVPGDDGAPGEENGKGQTSMVVGLVLGYMSAVCYLTARIPQIIKNWREKSTEGLALLFFLLSLTGNLTYGASLFAYSQNGAYLLKALPWLLGSLGTIVEDAIIFVQFQLYSPQKEAKSAIVNGDAED